MLNQKYKLLALLLLFFTVTHAIAGVGGTLLESLVKSVTSKSGVLKEQAESGILALAKENPAITRALGKKLETLTVKDLYEANPATQMRLAELLENATPLTPGYQALLKIGIEPKALKIAAENATHQGRAFKPAEISTGESGPAFFYFKSKSRLASITRDEAIEILVSRVQTRMTLMQGRSGAGTPGMIDLASWEMNPLKEERALFESAEQFWRTRWNGNAVDASTFWREYKIKVTDDISVIFPENTKLSNQRIHELPGEYSKPLLDHKRSLQYHEDFTAASSTTPFPRGKTDRDFAIRQYLFEGLFKNPIASSASRYRTEFNECLDALSKLSEGNHGSLSVRKLKSRRLLGVLAPSEFSELADGKSLRFVGLDFEIAAQIDLEKKKLVLFLAKGPVSSIKYETLTIDFGRSFLGQPDPSMISGTSPEPLNRLLSTLNEIPTFRNVSREFQSEVQAISKTYSERGAAVLPMFVSKSKMIASARKILDQVENHGPLEYGDGDITWKIVSTIRPGTGKFKTKLKSDSKWLIMSDHEHFYVAFDVNSLKSGLWDGFIWDTELGPSYSAVKLGTDLQRETMDSDLAELIYRFSIDLESGKRELNR